MDRPQSPEKVLFNTHTHTRVKPYCTSNQPSGRTAYAERLTSRSERGIMAPEGLQVCLGVPSEREPITTADPEPELSEERSFYLQAWQRTIEGAKKVG